MAMKRFLIPGGMGTLFKVLVQGKSAGQVELLGFEDPFRPSSQSMGEKEGRR
jgi:hypothetical protein